MGNSHIAEHKTIAGLSTMQPHIYISGFPHFNKRENVCEEQRTSSVKRFELIFDENMIVQSTKVVIEVRRALKLTIIFGVVIFVHFRSFCKFSQFFRDFSNFVRFIPIFTKFVQR